MRRRIAFLLSLLMILSSAATAWAAPGDYMNRQLQRRYRVNTPSHLLALEDDYNTDNIEVINAFYREIEDGVFVNFKEEERAEDEALEAYLRDNDLSAGDLANLSSGDLEALGIKLQEAKAQVPKYRLGEEGFITEEEFFSYAYPGEATLLNIDPPVAGGVVGSTGFEKLPTGYSGWRYKVASSQMPVPTEGEVLIGSYDYSEGRDILVNAGDYLLLVAVNASNRVQGYRQFPIEEGQIRQAGNVAEELELGQDYNNPISGTVAGTIRFAGLNLPEGTTKWQYRLRDLPTTAPMEDATVLDAVDYGIVATDDGGNIGKNISVVAGRYLTLLATDADGRVKKYATVQVMEKDIAVKAKSLEHNTHYPYPTPIDEGEDYHGKFAWLNFGSGSAKLEGATTWYYHVAETNSFEIPAVGAKIGEIPFFKGDDEKNKAGFKIYDPDNPEAINAKVNGVYGDLMLVAANAEDTILAYVILPLSGENVKLPEHEEARELQPLQEGETNNALKHYKLPLEMGSVPGTTKLQLLGNAGFGSANRWQIQVSDGPIPIPQEGTRLGNVTIANYYHASTYPFAGRDIPVKAGDYMMLYLTDADGFVEGYAKIGEKNEAAEIVIPEEWVRPPLAKEFIIGQHYSRPSVGAAAGTTRIELLNAPEGVDVYYTVETAPLDRPSGGDALPENAEVNLSKKQNESGKNYVDIDGVQANNYLALYGVQKDDDGNKHIHYFSNVLLSALQIREIDAKKLEIIEDANGGHYTAVEIGTEVGHVRIMKLDFGGISSDNLPINHLRWQVKVQPEALTFEPEGADTIALNTHIRPPNDSYLDNYYTEGKNIPIEEGQHLILYATDHHGGIKGYRDLGKMQADSIAEEAEALVAIDGEDGHYSTPVKGVDTGTTRIETLKGESNWGANYKWYYRVENPPVDYVGIKDLKLNVEEDFKAYNAGQDIPILAGQEIVLVATDEDGLIQAYGVIPVSGEQIQLPSAKVEGTAFADDLNEGHIREGGREIVIELENGKWVEDIATSEAKRNALFEGFHPFTEEHQWQKVVARLKADGVGAIRVDENFKIVTILLPATGDYGLHEYQTVRLTIPPEVIENASTKTVANQELRIAPMVSATVSGTVITPGIGEAEIRSGGGTIRLTLDKGMWLHDIASDGNTTEEMQEIRKFLLEGLSTTTDTKALNLLVEEMIEIVIGSEEEPATKGKPSAVLTRNTARELTITLPKVKDYNLNLGDQEVTVTIPAEAIIDGTTDVVASPSFTIKKAIPYIFDIKAEALENGNTVKMKGSESTSPLEENNTWTIKIEEGTLKEEISLEDITFEGLPAGLGVREVTRLDSDRHIQLPLSGTATTSIKDKTEVKLTIKHTMVQESGARDSQPISLWIAPGEFPIEAKAREGRDTITMLAPDNLKVLDGEDTWVIEVTEGAVKEDVSIEDLSFENALPTGLEATAKKGDGNTIEILVGGTANNKVEKKITEIKIRINKTAVLEGGAGDMEGTLTLKIATVESIDFPNLESPVGIHVKNNKLTNTTSAMEYSLDSTDGRDGTWHPASGSGNDGNDPPDTDVTEGFSEGFREGTVYVREKALPHNFHPVAELSHGDAPKVVADFSGEPSTIMLLGLMEGMQYNKEYPNDTKWEDVTVENKDKPINLSGVGNWDLRVRFSATEDTLASHPTEKLNGMDLTGVGVNVAAGKLTGTTDAMEYSLDSSTGTNGEWHSARNNDTNVNFVEGAVYVREKERRGNYRKVADITRQPLGNSDINGDEDGNGGIRYHVAEGWIQSPNKEGLGNLQYRIANGPWRDLESVAGAKTYGVDFQPGKLEFRLGATATELPSLAIPYHKAIQAAAAPPQLAYDDLHYRIEGLNETTGEEENAVAIYEYRVNDGPWQLGTVVPDFSGDDVVRLRRRATADTLASQQQIINFTPNLNLYTVGLDVANGRLTGTTTAMEYSLDSNNGTSGTWQQANNTNTPVDFVEEQKVYVREGAKPRNFLKLSGGISKLNRPTTNNITYNIMEGRITIPKAYNNQLQYRIGSGDWANLPYGEIVEGDAIVGGIPFTSGKLMVRFRATTDKLPSDGNEVAEIKAPRSAPALTYDDVDYKIFGLYTKDNANEVLYQYKINNGPWRDGTIEGSFQGSDRVLIRLKATENKLPGEVQEIVFTPNIDFSHVGVDLANSRITGTTTDMEYSLDSTGGKGGTWLPCNNNATDVGFVSGGEVYLRQRNKPLHFYKVTQTERQEALVQDDLDAIDFHIQEGWLEIPEVLVGKLQYRIDLEDQIGDWIDIVATQQVEGNKMRMTGITFREGKLSFRRRATETLMASPAATADNFVIKAAESRPIVKEDPIKNTFSIKVNDEFVAVGSNDNGLEYYVYRINEGPWIPATIENDFSGTMKVEVRKKATKEALPSQEATIHFERTLDLSHVGLSTHITPYELNGTTETMEFTLVHNDGKLLWNPNHASYEEEGVPYTHYTYVDSDGTKHAPKGYKWGSHWKSCEEGNTPLIQHNGDNINYENFSHVLVRDRNQPENYIVIPLPEN